MVTDAEGILYAYLVDVSIILEFQMETRKFWK